MKYILINEFWEYLYFTFIDIYRYISPWYLTRLWILLLLILYLDWRGEIIVLICNIYTLLWLILCNEFQINFNYLKIINLSRDVCYK